ncbi:MAG: hypothetical protein ACRC30_14360 [Clostridium sp.]
MGLFSSIGSAIGGIARGVGKLFSDNSSGIISSVGSNYSSGSDYSDSTSSSNTAYEPDKVRIAEIEQETQILLADREKERIKLMNEAKIDILQQEYYLKAAYDEAKVKGFEHMAHTIINMQDKLNEVAEKRLQIIEKGSMQLIKEVEEFYSSMEDKLNLENEEYNQKKLPALLGILEKFETGSAAHNLYAKKIEMDMSAQMDIYIKRISNIAERQGKVMDSLITSKERLLEQTGKMTEHMLEQTTIEYSKLTTGKTNDKELLLGKSDEEIKENKLLQ